MGVRYLRKKDVLGEPLVQHPQVQKALPWLVTSHQKLPVLQSDCLPYGRKKHVVSQLLPMLPNITHCQSVPRFLITNNAFFFFKKINLTDYFGASQLTYSF